MLSRSTVTSSPTRWALTAPRVMTTRAVRHLHDLLVVGGDDEDADPVGGERPDRAVDLGAGADVDAARRLDQDEDSRAGLEPSARAAPSAGCRPRASRSSGSGSLRERMLSTSCQRRYALACDPGGEHLPGARETGPRRRAQVLGHRADHERAVVLPVGREEADARSDRMCGAVQLDRRRRKLELSAAELPDAERDLADLGGARPDLSVQRDHLAIPDREVEILERRAGPGGDELQHLGGRDALGRGGTPNAADLASDHGRDQLRARVRRRRPFEHRRTVAQDVHAVGDAGHLVEPMRDVDDRDAAIAKTVDERKQPLDLLVRQSGRRLVEDEAAGVAEERAGDLDHLALGDAELRHGSVRGRARLPARSRIRRAFARSVRQLTKPCRAGH